MNWVPGDGQEPPAGRNVWHSAAPPQPLLLESMAHRRRPSEWRGDKTPARMREFDLPRPGIALLLARAGVWVVAAYRFWSGSLLNRLRGRREGPAERGQRMRGILESMGGTALKMGRQMALRLDILPLEICNELSRICDQAAPMALSDVVERIEAAGGRPLDALYETIDPEPIVSNSVACVFQAKLLGAGRVAIKVRRLHVVETLSADLSALAFLLKILEFLTVIRPGRYSLLERELRLKLGEELDYTMAARYQRLFRRRAKRDRLKYLSAAKVFSQLSSSDVMVSEFVAGVWCQEVVVASQRGDTESLAWLDEQDIDPRTVATRLLQAMWWSQLENPFFPVEPRAQNIVIQPGNRIVFIDLGECGRVSTGNRALVGEAQRRIVDGDVSGASDVLLQSLMPLPYIDADDFRSQLERGLWQHLFSLQHREAPWWERSSTRMWLDLLQTAQKFGVPVRLQMVRLMRSTLAAEHIAGSLWPSLRLLGEYRRYLHRADRRYARRTFKAQEEASGPRADRAQSVRIADLGEQLRRLRFWVDSNTRELPVNFMSLSAKGAFVVSSLLQVVAAGAGLIAVALLVLFVQAYLAGTQYALSDLSAKAIQHPFVIGAFILVFLLAIRRVLFRLGDRDRHV